MVVMPVNRRSSLTRIATSGMLPENRPSGLRRRYRIGRCCRWQDGSARELTAAVVARYRSARRAYEGCILDELCAVTGWHRKHTVRALASHVAVSPEARRHQRPTYGATIRGALEALWETSDRICGKQLKVMVPPLLPSLELHGRPLDDGSTSIFSTAKRSLPFRRPKSGPRPEVVQWLPPHDSNVPSSVNSGAPSPRWLDGNEMVEQRRVELRTSILQGSTAARCLPRNGAQRQI